MEQLAVYSKNLFGSFDDAINEEEKTVSGFFTDGLVDDHGHMIDESAMMDGIAEYRKWGNIRDMHGGPVGIAVDVGMKAWNYVTAKIVKSDVWDLIREHVYKGFSVGLIVTGGELVPISEIPVEKFAGVTDAIMSYIEEFGYVFKITKLALVEISVVDRPANPRAVFAASKSGGVHQLDVLPSVLREDGVAAIESVYAGVHGDTVKIDKDSVFVASTEASLREGDINGIEDEQGGEMEDNTTVEGVDVNETDEVVVEDAPEIGTEPVEVTEDVEVQKTVEQNVVDVDAIVAKVVDAISESIGGINKEIAGLTGIINKIVDSLEKAEEAEVVEEPEVVESVEKELSDEEIEKIADVVIEKSAIARKSVVSSDGAGVEEKEVDIKTIDNKSLVSLIASRAVR